MTPVIGFQMLFYIVDNKMWMTSLIITLIWLPEINIKVRLKVVVQEIIGIISFQAHPDNCTIDIYFPSKYRSGPFGTYGDFYHPEKMHFLA